MSFQVIYRHEFNHLWPQVVDHSPNQSEESITVSIYHVYQNRSSYELTTLSIQELVEYKKKIKTETHVMRELILKMKNMPQLQLDGMMAGLNYNQEQIKMIDKQLPDQTYTLGDEVIIS